jgi:hypothetical protein
MNDMNSIYHLFRLQGTRKFHQLFSQSIFRDAKKPIPTKTIIENNINDVFKRKDQVLQSIVVDQYRKELEKDPDETADIVEQLDTMVEQSMETTTLNENLLASIFTVSNKKYIEDPLQERRALAELMGQKLIIHEDNEHS